MILTVSGNRFAAQCRDNSLERRLVDRHRRCVGVAESSALVAGVTRSESQNEPAFADLVEGLSDLDREARIAVER